MRQRGISHRLSSLMTSRPTSRAVGVALITLLAAATPAAGAVTLSASRTELLYSTDKDPDCSKLHNLSNAALPFYATRIEAAVEGAPAGVPIRYRWSMSKPRAGTLAADLDLGPSQETSAVDGMCADFGNVCILTEDKLRFYNEKSLLFLAPTCDGLPKDTTKQFRGAVVRIHLKASAGRRRLGSARARIGYGRDGAVKVFTWTGELRRDQLGLLGVLVLDDGLRKPNGVGVPLNAVFGAVAQPPAVAPGPIVSFELNNGGGGDESVGPSECGIATAPPVQACAEVDYMGAAGGKFVPTVAAKFGDGSALCDNMTTHLLGCSGALRIDVKPKPKLSLYDPSSPRSNVEVVVRVTNVSQARGGLPACGIDLSGPGVLTCAENLKVGAVTDSKNTSFDLRHCSSPVDQPCDTNDECAPGEVCLTQPHCSTSVKQPCGNDKDCDNQGSSPPCPSCQDNETCVRVLDLPSLVFLNPGQSIIMLDQPVTLRNEFPDTARMKDTWTVTARLQQISADTVVKYKIRGRPSFSPAQ